MCGIFFSLSRGTYNAPNDGTKRLLRNRGPDAVGDHRVLIPGSNADGPCFHAAFLSTVLSLRGADIVRQPLEDKATGSTFCWNGEAWAIDGDSVIGNDSGKVLQLLLTASRPPLSTPHVRSASVSRVLGAVASIRGPFAFVYYDAVNEYLYYGRDCLGRRSLLRKASQSELILSSVCDNANGEDWAEVDADGLYMVDLTAALEQDTLAVTHIPYRHDLEQDLQTISLQNPFPAMSTCLPNATAVSLHGEACKLEETLRKSLDLRTCHVRDALETSTACMNAKVAILFSGGLDCAVLARLSHDLLPLAQSIDLLNVAFQNPRIHGDLDRNPSPYELCPDRITGRASFAELLKTCPGRQWRFIEVNVPYSETVAQRSHVMRLMHPHNTEMDLSISYALFFASRGAGFVRDADNIEQPYTTSAHVLLSGLGADELFGGYQRHALAYSRKGYTGLIEELNLDFQRLGKRNLGRDDRVISDSGREIRFPYLDEQFISLALQLPVNTKCDFGKEQIPASEDPIEALEPGKRLLRLVAWNLGMKGVAAEKKRAIQFGARTAKMETGKSKGTQMLS